MGSVLQTFNNISYSKENLEDGRLKINIEIENERFQVVKQKVYDKLAKEVTIEGFRPGKAPENMIMAQLGPKLYEETLQELLPVATLEVIKREEIIPLDKIAYSVEKVGEGSGVKYSATFTVFPEFKLPDLSKIKVQKETAEVTEEEVKSVLEKMHDEAEKREKKKIKMDDSWAKSMNMEAKTLDELKKNVEKELKRQKATMEENNYIDAILTEIIEKSKFEVPTIMIDQELERREGQYKTRIEQLGMKVEDFLRNQKTTMDKIKEGWRKEAEKQLKTEVILIKVSNEHKIVLTNEDVDEQIAAIKDEKVKAQYETNEAKNYLKSILVRQRVVKKITDLVEGK
ncbi:MAG: trigger factor [Patescibacteria group bacterium]